MDLDNEELKITRTKNKVEKEYVSKEKIQEIIRDRIWQIDNDEWNIPNAKEVKFYCEEELEGVLFQLLKEC